MYFVLLAESTKFSSIRKPYTYTSVSDTTVIVRKFLAYESWQTLEYEIFSRPKISAMTVQCIHNTRLTRHAVRSIERSGGIPVVGVDIKTFRRATPSSVGRSGKIGHTNYSTGPFYRSNRIYCVVSIVCCVYHVCRK